MSVFWNIKNYPSDQLLKLNIEKSDFCYINELAIKETNEENKILT